MEFCTLSTGAHMPLLGLGTWQGNNRPKADSSSRNRARRALRTAGSVIFREVQRCRDRATARQLFYKIEAKDELELTSALRFALDNGYKLIDTAFLYANEKIIGDVLKEYLDSGKIKREELFITSKLPFSCHHPDDVPKVVAQQLEWLQLDYIDLYLIHGPCGFKKQPDSFSPLVVDGQFVADEVTHIETWRALEKLHKDGKLRALGLSNFNDEQVKDLYEKAEVKPSNLQVECHIYWPQFELHELCRKLNISFTAYAPIGSPGRKNARPDGTWPEGEPMEDPLVQELARKYHKTPAQILLRHLTQRGISAIPKSVRPDRVLENIQIFDFKLTDDEYNRLNKIDRRVRLFLFDFGAHHRYFPHKDVKLELVHKQP